MKLRNLVTTFAVIGSASAVIGCMYGEGGERVGEALQGAGGTGTNNVSPLAVDALSLKLSVMDDYGITNSANGVTDPLQLCISDNGTGCTMRAEWEHWLNDDKHNGHNAIAHQWMMKGIAKCAAEASYTISTSDNHQYPGQWPFETGWKTGRLVGSPAHERVSACILTLLNGNDETLQLCVIGPGGSPYSDACDDPQTFTVREGGFFGDLFSSTPAAYVVGPNDAPVDVNGRDCYATQGTYCCDEMDTSCGHHIFRAGGLTGTDTRCDSWAYTGPNNTGYAYCAEYFTNREPGRKYKNGFVTFIPHL